MNRIGFFLVAVAAVLSGLLVGALNPDRVTLDLLWFQLDWPLGLLLLLTLSAGVLAGLALAYLFQVLPLKLRLRKTRQAASSAPEAALEADHD